MKLYDKLISYIEEIDKSAKRGNIVLALENSDEAKRLTWKYMPSGNGIVEGPTISITESTCKKLVFTFKFRHLDSDGQYDGWTRHTVIAKPSSRFGFYVRVSGTDWNNVLSDMEHVFTSALEQEIE